MYEVDARGLSCPEPVMLTAAALKEKASDSAFRFLLVTVENHRCQQD